MKLQILGSAAAEAVPSTFCTCEICAVARKNPKERRRRTAYVLDDDTLIDFGPDIREQLLTFGVDEFKLKQLIITHAHRDHLNMDPVANRPTPFAVNAPVLDFYSDTAGQKFIEEHGGFERLHFNPCPIHPGDRLTTADGTLEIFAVRASHDADAMPLNYALKRGGKTLLLANDTGIWTAETWDMMKDAGYKFDCAVIDCTAGLLKNFGWTDCHLGCDEVIAMRAELIRRGMMTEDALCIANHFSHGGLCLQQPLEDYLEPHGIWVGYDGMKVEF